VDVFDYFFRVGEVACYDDETQVAELGKNMVRIRVLACERAPPPLLERSCSIYRRAEDHFPDDLTTYRVVKAIRHRFCNQHSSGRPFYYDILEVENVDDRYYTTFCLRTDGAILNLESLSLRGYATKIEVVRPLTIGRLRVG
jgi:hypothetical protein